MPGPGQGRGEQRGGGFSPRGMLCAQTLLSITSPSLRHPPPATAHPLHPQGEERVQVSPGPALPSLNQGINPQSTQQGLTPSLLRSVAITGLSPLPVASTPLLPGLRALILPLPSPSLNYSWVSAVVQKRSQRQNPGTLGKLSPRSQLQIPQGQAPATVMSSGSTSALSPQPQGERNQHKSSSNGAAHRQGSKTPAEYGGEEIHART